MQLPFAVYIILILAVVSVRLQGNEKRRFRNEQNNNIISKEFVINNYVIINNLILETLLETISFFTFAENPQGSVEATLSYK